MKRGIITRALLKRLLYRQFADENVNVLGVKVRRSHKVECVIFPTQLSFGIFKSSKTWKKTQTIELDSTSTSTDEYPMINKGQKIVGVDHKSDDNSCGSDSVEFIKYFPVNSKILHCEENHTKSESDTNQNVVEKRSLPSGGSSFDVPPIPITYRACEDLSVLEVIEMIDVDKVSRRKSLPSFLSNSVRHSIELSCFERSVSLDLINFLKFPLKPDAEDSNYRASNSTKTLSSERSTDNASSICFKTSHVCVVNENSKKSYENLRRRTSNPSLRNYGDQCLQLTPGLSACSFPCSSDVLGSPRSSDSGLADITGTSTSMLPNSAQDCERWNSRTGSLYDSSKCVSFLQVPVTSDEFESQYVRSPFGATQLSLTSKNIYVGSPIKSSDPSSSEFDVSSSTRWIDGSGVYRSGMYAHWWLKTRIPLEALDGGSDSPKNSSKGKNSVPLTVPAFLFSLLLILLFILLFCVMFLNFVCEKNVFILTRFFGLFPITKCLWKCDEIFF